MFKLVKSITNHGNHTKTKCIAKKKNGVAARNNDLVCAFIDYQSDYKNELKLSDSETFLPGTKSSVFFGFTFSWLFDRRRVTIP